MVHTLSSQGAAFIQGFEGLRLSAYDDGHGVLTIGYGHTGSVTVGETITLEQAGTYFKEDIQWAVEDVNGAVKVRLQQYQFDALISFTFNVGGEAFKSSTLLEKLNAGDYEAVPDEMNRWIYSNKNSGGIWASLLRVTHLGSGKEIVPALKARRTAEGLLFLKGDYGK